MKKLSWLQLVGVVIIARIIYKLDFQQFLSVFSNVDFQALTLSAICLLIFGLSKSIRWYSFLRIQKLPLRLFQTINIYLIGQLFSLVTPAKLGEFIKVFYVEKETPVNHSQALSSVVADRLCDLLMLFSIAIICIQENFLPKPYQTPCEIVSGLLLLSLLLLLHRRSALVLYDLIKRLPFIGSYFAISRKFFSDFYNSFSQFKCRMVIIPIALTFSAYLFLFFHAYYLAQALRIDMTLKETVFCITISNIAALLPISVGGLGPREQAMKEFFTRVLPRGNTLSTEALSYLSASAVGFSLAFYGMFLLTAGVFGYIAWLRNPVSLSSVQRLADEIRLQTTKHRREEVSLVEVGEVNEACHQ